VSVYYYYYYYYYSPEVQPHLVITNPPWDMRLNEGAGESWDHLGLFLSSISSRGSTSDDGRTAATTAWVLTGNTALLKRIPLEARNRIKLHQSGLELNLVKYLGEQDDEDMIRVRGGGRRGARR